MKDEIVARLTINGLPQMKAAQLKTFRKWILRVAKELQTLDPKAFTKRCRFTLYK